MKVLKILGAIFGVLVLLVVGAWFMLLSPPSPESVCDNISKLFEKGDMKLSERDKKECVTDMAKEPMSGRVKWVKDLKCLRDAESMKELASCGGGKYFGK